MAITIDYESNWEGRLMRRLYEQFKGLRNWTLYVKALARQFQDLEDAFQSVPSIVSIDDSIGAQLDNLGRLIGQPRTGLGDATYRQYLKARIIANKSNGTAENIYSVFRALFDSIGFIIRNGGNKSFALQIIGTITPTQSAAARDFLIDSKEAGARAIIEFATVADGNLLRFNVVGHGFGATTLGSARQV